MTEHKAEAPSAETASHARRQVLKLLSTVACGAFAMGIAGCAPAQERELPDWIRSKQGSNGNGRGRK